MKVVFVSLVSFLISFQTFAADCASAIVDFQNVLTTTTEQSAKAYAALETAKALGDQRLIDSANSTIREIVIAGADQTKVAKMDTINACNRSNGCVLALTEFQNVASNRVRKLALAYSALEKATSLGVPAQIEVANTVIREIVMNGAAENKASKIKANDACN